MKELGEVRHILGMRIEINQTKKILQLSQSDYIGKVLKQFNMYYGQIEVGTNTAPDVDQTMG